MKIIALTDIHSKLQHLDAAAADLRAADLVLLPGDLTMFGKRDKAMEVVDAVCEHNDWVLGVMGNCDFPEVSEYLSEKDFFLHASHRIVDGIAFVGLGGSLPCPIPTLNEWQEEEIGEYLAAALEGLPEDIPMVLMSHQPPKDTVVDLAGIGAHVGSEAVRVFIEEYQPLICFSGHIHEARGTDTIGETKLINPGPFMDGHYAWAEIDSEVTVLEARTVS